MSHPTTNAILPRAPFGSTDNEQRLSVCVSALPLLIRSIRETVGRQLLEVSGRGDVRRGGKGAETGGETGERGRKSERGGEVER